MVLFPHVYKKLDYDAVKDFTPISQIARFQFGVVSGPASNVKTVAEMVTKAKTDPNSASYGTPGAGTLPHFMGVLMEQSAGISLNHSPFQGGAPANTALLGGHIGYKFDVVSETAEMHRAGKVRIIAVTGGQRLPHKRCQAQDAAPESEPQTAMHRRVSEGSREARPVAQRSCRQARRAWFLYPIAAQPATARAARVAADGSGTAAMPEAPGGVL
jgi:hypothetical protein